MSTGPADLEPMRRLLEQGLIAWRLLGRVHWAEDGAIRISGLGRQIIVRRAPAALPFRWMVAIDGRERPALSVVTVLRQVRAALDPSFKPARVRIGAALLGEAAPREAPEPRGDAGQARE